VRGEIILKTAYVTGADRGLGLALSKVLVSKGYHVFAGSYMPDWHELKGFQKEHPKNLTILPLDVTDEDSVKNAAKQINTDVGSLDILINNAAIFADPSGDIFGEFDYDTIRRHYETNTLGPLRVTHSVVPLVIRSEQKLIVNISSEAGSIGDCWRTKEYGYSMSKAALNMQGAILQNHLKEFGVKVFLFHPGFLRSYIFGDGKINERGTEEPLDSAKGIIEQILTPRSLDKPTYIDYQGKELPW